MHNAHLFCPAALALSLLTACPGPTTPGPVTSQPAEDAALVALQRTEAERSAQLSALPPATPWSERVLYFALLDRFSNGDYGNDDAHGVAACNDHFDPHAFQGGDLAGLQDRLAYIEELGADALWVSPLYRGVPNKAGANCGFPGYWVDFEDPYELALDPRYGDAAAFDAVIDEAHGRGMTVMLDMVVNHAGYDATLVGQHPEWFHDPNTCAQGGQPEIDCPLAGLPDFDHDVPAAAGYLVDVHHQWVERFDLDGIRMDTVKHVTPSYFSRWTDAMREVRPALYMVGELLDEGSFVHYDGYLSSGFDGLFNFPLRQGLIATFARGESTDVVAGRMLETWQRFGPEQTKQLVNLLDNHDVHRFTEEIPRHLSPDVTRARYLMAMTALLTLPGIPQIYYGNEIGMYGGQDPDNRRFMPWWAFYPLTRQGQSSGVIGSPNIVWDTTQRLIALRRAMPALKRGDYRELWRQNGPAHNNVWAFARHTDEQTVIVAFNNGEQATDGAVPLHVTGLFGGGTVLTDVLGRAGLSDITVDGDTLWLALPAQSAVVLQNASSPHPIDERFDVTFSVQAQTHWGQNVYLTGSPLDLGGWNLGQAVKLAPQDCIDDQCSWRTTVALPRDETFTFKFVKIDDQLSAQWEAGFNHVLTPTENTSVSTTFQETYP